MKKINLEKLLLIFIATLPILDISSFLFRNYFNTNFSLSTFIRPIIPIIVIITIFFKYNFKSKTILFALAYASYAIIHLYIFNKLKTGISFGTITHEAQYLINYTFGILNLFIFLFVFYKNDNKKILSSIIIANGIYILSLYIAIFTKTSSSTYLEGIGYKGWFESGNSISAILILNLFIIFTVFNSLENIKIQIISSIEIILSGIFLMFLLGTRTGLYGFILVIAVFVFSKIFVLLNNKLINKNVKLNNKTKIVLAISSLLVICAIILVVFKGSSILKRRKYLQSIENNIYDASTGQVSHITGDILKFKEQIELGNVSEDYISKPAQKSVTDLYNYANNNNISNTNRRIQQLVYNTYLVKNQLNPIYILFGNGFLTNYGELILEMEIPAFLFNFGLIGLILYFIPFLILAIYYIYFGIKNIKKIDEQYIILLCGILVSFGLSLLVGQIFFNSSALTIIIIMNVLLFSKCLKIKEEKTIKNNKMNLNNKKPALIK